MKRFLAGIATLAIAQAFAAGTTADAARGALSLK